MLQVRKNVLRVLLEERGMNGLLNARNINGGVIGEGVVAQDEQCGQRQQNNAHLWMA